MPNMLLAIQFRAAIRYIGYDYDEFVRLRDEAIDICREMEEEELRRMRLYVPVQEILEWKSGDDVCRLIS